MTRSRVVAPGAAPIPPDVDLRESGRKRRPQRQRLDISMPVGAGTPEWPGDTPWSCTWAWRMADGASVNVSCLRGSPHVGTHADAPLHVRDGAPAVHELPLAAYDGPATVCDVRGKGPFITRSDLPPEIAGGRLLLRTGHSIASGTFPEGWPVLAPDALERLIAEGLTLVGVDCPSVDERHSTTLATHHRIFAAGAYILENLDLSHAPGGVYHLTAYPLRLTGADAAPVRAVLMPA